MRCGYSFHRIYFSTGVIISPLIGSTSLSSLFRWILCIIHIFSEVECSSFHSHPIFSTAFLFYCEAPCFDFQLFHVSSIIMWSHPHSCANLCGSDLQIRTPALSFPTSPSSNDNPFPFYYFPI